MPSAILLASVLLVLAACTPLPHQRTEGVAPGVPVTREASANHDARRPNYVVLHHTSDSSTEGALRTLTRAGSDVSSHYLIARDGRIFYLVDETRRAWHAGESYWSGQRDLNSASIGIELDNDGREPFAEPQIAALLALLSDLQARYKLPPSAFLGHGDIAPGRKVDPSPLFPWKRLADSGFGLWCDPPYPAVPTGVDTALLLHAFGYNVGRLDAAIGAFKRRFAPEDPSPQMTERDRSMLYCLILKMRSLESTAY